VTVRTRCSALHVAGVVAGSALVGVLVVVRVGELGWSVLEVLVACATLSALVVLAANYPLVTVFDAEGARIRTVLRARTVGWNEVLAIRRTRGRRTAGPSGARTARGGLLLVTSKGGVLATDRRMPLVVVEGLVHLLDGVSPALADSLRSVPPDAR